MIKIGLTDYTPVNKIIDIRDKKQVIKAKYAIGANDVLKHTLMGEHYIEISFEFNMNVSFKRSDYIEWNGDKYTLRANYEPEQINKYKYKYTLTFEAIELFFQDIQYYYLNQNLKEAEWRLIGNPEYFIKIAVDNINRYFGVSDFKVGTIEPIETKDILFDTNTNTFDALIQIANEYSAEWYMTGKTIHLLNKISFGSEVDFETEVSVLSMKRNEGESTSRYTRIVALGSTRNIPKDYRATSQNDGVDAIYPKRLRIPISKGDVIDAYSGMLPEEVVEGTVIFDEIYPKRVGTIEAVSTIEYTDTDEETGVKTKWNAFKLKDSGINFKEEYVLPGEELRLQFESGDLNGRDFALIFHGKGFTSTDNSQYFEIVRTNDYGKDLPNDIMKPKAGDKYVLYGFNIALVSDQYVPAGEQELYDTAKTWLQKQLQDTGVYECPTIIKHFHDNVMDLKIGQKVKLIKSLGGGRNYLLDSRYDNLTRFTGAGGGTRVLVDDSYFGKVVEYSRPAGGGEYQTQHSYNKNSVLNQDIVFFIIAKDMAGGGTFSFGGWQDTYTKLTQVSNKIDKGNGWYTYWVTFKSGATLGGTFGLNSVKGTWRFYAAGILQGNKATDWTPAPEDVPDAIRLSRIMGFEKKLNNIFDAVYTVGDNSTYSRLASIEKEIKELQHAGIVYENTGGNGVYIIKQFDTTHPTDFNVYSAQASNSKYFNKQTGGAVQGDTIFQKNMQVQGSAISDVFQNSTFTAGQFGSGFQIKRDANGQSYMEVDNLLVRRETVFNRLTIAEIKSVGGTILLSLANMLLSKVEDKASTWKCFFDTGDGTIPNDFAIGDQAICRKFTGKDIKYYWALVIAVGTDYIEISKSDKDGSGVPAIGDEVVQMGNRTDVNRQYAIMLSAYGSDAPSIKQYAGINSYDLTGKEVTAISPKGNKFTGSFTISTNGTTAPVYKERGAFVNGTTYYLNDRVSYLGSHWVCIVTTTITTPSETSSTWRKETAGQNDINNAVDNIKVGGRNYALNTSAERTWSHWGDNKVCRFLMSEDIINKEIEVIITFFCKNTTNVTGSGIGWGSADAWNKLYFAYPNNAEGIHQIKVLKPLGVSAIWLYHNSQTTVYNFSLQTGNKPTDWTPAPEDTQTEINNISERLTISESNVTVLQNEIKLTVKQSEFDSLEGRVSTAESTIIQQAGLIESTVQKVDKKNAAYKSYTNVSTDRPSVPYSKGDIWITYDGTIKQAQNTRLTGSFILSDWVDTTKYTDDTAVNNLQIGGVNLLKGSASMSTLVDKNVWGHTALNYNAADFEGGTRALQITPGTGNNVFRITKITQDADVKSFVYSIWVKAVSGTVTFRMDICDKGTVTFTATTEWKRYAIYVNTSRYDASYGVFCDLEFQSTTALIIYKPQVEYGNKLTDWSLSSYDIQTGINNAQTTADAKNKTYYQDTTPTIPSGGHKVGDLWYKISLTDECYLSYRWNGTMWQEINKYVSSAKQTITDSSITNLVKKTGINNVGTGSTLYSMINQTAEQITLEVNKINIGGRNYLLDSRYDNLTRFTGVGGGTRVLVDDSYFGKVVEYSRPAGGGEFQTQHNYNKNGVLNQDIVFFIIAKDMAGGGTFSFGGWQDTYTKLTQASNKIDKGNGWYIYWVTFKSSAALGGPFGLNSVKGTWRFSAAGILQGNKTTDWTPAPEDTQASIDKAQTTADSKTTLTEVSSSFTIAANKISLASKTIELKGTTIAEAIKAERLNINNKAIIESDGSASFGNGTTIFNANGSGSLANGNIAWDNTGNFAAAQLRVPFQQIFVDYDQTIVLENGFNISARQRTVEQYNLLLPNNKKYDGVTCCIFNASYPMTRYSDVYVAQEDGQSFGGAGEVLKTGIAIPKYKAAFFMQVTGLWIILNYKELL